VTKGHEEGMMRMKKITEEDIDRIADDEGIKVTWRTPPEGQGQIVTASYAGLGDAGVVMSVYDASDRTDSYYLRPWRADDEDCPGLNFVPKGF
jgi:hypothetical protein